MASQYFGQSIKKAQEGQIYQSIQFLKKDIDQNGQRYSTYSNLSALYLQLGNIQEAIQNSTRAIELDPFSYIAYYNRFLCYFSKKDEIMAWNDIQKALSCLYMSKGYEQNNLKLLNKAIKCCEYNVKAYLLRAKINIGKNNKLVQNDYSAAIQYGPTIAEIYQQRAIYYRSINKTIEFQEDLQKYLRLKKQSPYQYEGYMMLENDKDKSYLNHLKEKIRNAAKQFQLLLITQSKSEEIKDANDSGFVGIGKLPLNSIKSEIQNNYNINQQLLLSDRPDQDQGTAKTIQIKQEVVFKKKQFEDRFDKNFKQIFQDQNSKELNEQIQKLQQDIQANGGRVSLNDKEDLDNSDTNNFLTYEIEKAIEQIENLKNTDITEIKSVKSANSKGSPLQNKGKNKQLNIADLAQYKFVKLYIENLECFADTNKKQNSFVYLKYGKNEAKSKESKFEWNQQLKFFLQQNEHEIEVHVTIKGGIFRRDYEFAQGTINLLDLENRKCILGNKEKKVAILRFKLTFE